GGEGGLRHGCGAGSPDQAETLGRSAILTSPSWLVNVSVRSALWACATPKIRCDPVSYTETVPRSSITSRRVSAKNAYRRSFCAPTAVGLPNPAGHQSSGRLRER